jgi:DNA-binding protein HU-beta
MNRTELVAAVTERAGIPREHVDAALQALAEVVAESLAAREKVALPGFVTFEAVHRSARTGRNPRTGEPLEIPAAWTAKATPGAALKNAVR